MKKLTKQSLDELAKVMPVLSEEVQISLIGGYRDGYYTYEEYQILCASGQWYGGNVSGYDDGNSGHYIEPTVDLDEVVISVSAPTGTYHSPTGWWGYDSSYDFWHEENSGYSNGDYGNDYGVLSCCGGNHNGGGGGGSYNSSDDSSPSTKNPLDNTNNEDFKIPVHKEITNLAIDALRKKGLNIEKRLDIDKLLYGVGVKSDIWGAMKDIHFDNKKDIYMVVDKWKDINKNLDRFINKLNTEKSLNSRETKQFGVLLHNVQNFYSHSNYLELYIEFYGSKHTELLPLEDIPTFTEAFNISPEFTEMLNNRLRTGDFSLPKYLLAKIGIGLDEYNQPTNHSQMNKDKANNVNGVLAKRLALKHVQEIFNQISI